MHADLPKLAALPRLSRPRGALAHVRQRFETTMLPVPAGFESYLDALRRSGASCACSQPSRSAAQHFIEACDGWRAAQCVLFVTHSLDAAKLVEAESCELRAHRAGDARVHGDGTLAARAIAVWVVLRGARAPEHVACVLLDALATLADVRDARGDLLRAHVRLSVCTEPCAESARLVGAGECADACTVVVRACVRGEVRRHLCSTTVPASAELALAELQRATLRACEQLGAPFPGLLALPAPTRVVAGEFARALQRAHERFRAFVEPAAHVELGPGVRARADLKRVERVAVRITERELGRAGVSAPSAFHAVLAAPPERHGSLLSFLRAHADADGVLRASPPNALGAHVCTTTAEPVAIRQGELSLFGARGRPGVSPQPSEAPPFLTWLIAQRAVLRPLAVEGAFDHWLCASDALVPFEPALRDACRAHAQRGLALLTTPLCDASALPVHDGDALASPERVAAFEAGMALDPTSERTTVGDAIAAHVAHAGMTPLSNALVRALAALPDGPRASLRSAFELLGTSVREGARARDGAACAAMQSAVLELALPRPPERARVVPLPQQAVRALLRALGYGALERSVVVRVGARASSAHARVARFVESALALPTRASHDAAIVGRALEVGAHAFARVRAPSEDEDDDEVNVAREVARALAVTVRALAIAYLAVPARVFVLTQTARGRHARVLVERATNHPPLARATLDELVAEHRPTVFAIRPSSANRVVVDLAASAAPE
jgi:hypothetical protein